MRRLLLLIAACAGVVALSGCAAAPPEAPDVAPVVGVASSSPEPTPTAQPERVPIPSVKGKSVEMAEWKLQQAGFATKRKWKASSIRRGKVLSQAPSKGTAPTGSVVVLTVSEGPSRDSEEEALPDEPGSSSNDQAAQRAFDERQSGIALAGEGTVARVLSDDTNGSRHQRFILRLESGQTLLVAHNIDIAPRLPALAPGDSIAFKGVYEWNDQGGTVHWTHHDPDGDQPGGWLKFNGSTYR